MQRQRGFTLLELLVVLAIIAVSVAGVRLALRDNQETQLTREAQRLVAMLEAGRVQSRTRGVALVWEPSPTGFVIRAATPPPAQTLAPNRTEAWLASGTQASSAQAVVLGPEPILTPIRITLSVANTSRTIATDGLRPFEVLP
jgi:general secretion pathway protein H